MPDAEDPDQQADKRNDPMGTGDAIAGRPPQNDVAAARKPDEDSNNKKTNRFSFKVTAELFLGFVIAGATVINVCVAYRQWSVMVQNNGISSGQLESMTADQRAWIYPASIKIIGPLIFNQEGAEITIVTTIKNTGRLPALQAFVPLTLEPREPPQQLFDESQRIQLCRGIGHLTSLGYNVFGGQEITTTPDRVSTHGIFGNNRTPKEFAPDKPTSLIISGCIRYQSGSDPTARCTGIWSVLTHGADDFIFIPNRTYMPNELALKEMPVGQFVDDCNPTK
jgi:hypothetical protein